MPPVTSLPNTIAPTKPAIHRGSSGHYYGALPDQTTANLYASMMDIIISNPQKFESFADGMVTAAGNLKLILGEYDKSIQSDSNVNFPENWYSHSSSTLTAANRIPVGFSSKYTQMQADHSSATYTDSRGFTATTWKEWISKDHWHNVSSVNAQNTHAPLNTIYFDSMDENDGNRISWQDGHAYTDPEWYQINWSIGDYARSIRPAPGMWAGGNGMKSGSFYMGNSTDPANPTGNSADFPNHLDWVLAEDFIRGNFDSVTTFPSNSTLEKNINMVKSATIKGKLFWCVTNIQNWAASPNHAAISVTAAQAMQWRRYSMVTYLLGNDGNAVFEFVENNKTIPGWREDHPWYHVVLGLPLDTKNASAYLSGTTGLYTRNYELGTVYLNNTGAGVTFNPGTGFTQVDGTAVPSTVTVAAHDALILLHAQQTGTGGGGGTQAAKKLPGQGLFKYEPTPITSIESAYVGSFDGLTYAAAWANLQDTNGTTLSGSDIVGIDAAIAWCRANSKQLKIRLFCAGAAPTWLQTLVGTFTQVDVQDYNTNPATAPQYTVCKFWTTAYLNAYDKLQQLLAARYDNTDVLADVTISGTGTIFAEPLSRQVGLAQNRAEMVGGGIGWAGANITPAASAGYSDALNRAAISAVIQSHLTWWQNVNMSFAFIPYHTLLSQAEAGITYAGDNQVYDSSDDSTLSKTKSVMDEVKTSLGDRGVLENNSVRETFFTYDASGKATGITAPTTGYGLLYTYIVGYGPNTFFQCANSSRIGDFDKTLDGITNILKANAVEPPGDYAAMANKGLPTDSEWSPTNFSKWNQLLETNPITAVGTGGGGTGGGTYTDNLVVQDTYTRVVAAGGLGTSDSGHTYTIASGTATDFSVDGAKAVVNNPTANRSHLVVVNGFAVQDMHAIGKWSFNEVPVGDVQVFQVWVRVDATATNGYRLRCTMNPTTNTLTMVIQKVVAGATVTVGTIKSVVVGSSNLAPAANDIYMAELQCTGINPTVLEASFYRLSDGKPVVWMDTAQDSEIALQVATLSAGWNSFIGSAITNLPVLTDVYDFNVYQRVAAPPTNLAPTLSNPSPADGASVQIATSSTTFSVPFVVTATDVDGTITGVTIQAGDNAQPTAMAATGSTYKKTIKLAAGTYNITYTATDNAGAATTLVTSLVVLAASVPPPPIVTVDVPVPVDVQDPETKPEFAVLHQRHDGSNIGEVSGTDLRFGKFVMQPGYITYDLNRAHPLAPVANSEPNKTDFALTRNGVEILTGEIISRDADTDTDMVSIAGNDWLTYLDSLYLDFDPTNLKSGQDYTAIDTDLKDIAEGLIQKVLNSYNNTIDITMNNAPTGLIQSQHFAATDLNSLKSMLDTLAGQNPGFEYEITHDQEFVMYSPQRTDQSIYRLDRSNILQVHYGLQGVPGTTVYGRGSGSGSAQALRKSTSAITAAVYRDRVQVIDFGTVSSRKMLASLTDKKLGELSKQKLQFWITIRPRPLDNVYASVFPGQYVYIDYTDTYIVLQGWYRCAGYEAFINTAGDEQVTFNFNTDDTTVGG